MSESQNIENILKDLISREYEEDWFEFKENWFDAHQLGEYISGMSNAAAMVGQEFAYFVWGIENSTHKVVGTKFDYHRDVDNEPLEHYLARNIRPDMDFKFKDTNFQGKKIVAKWRLQMEQTVTFARFEIYTK